MGKTYQTITDELRDWLIQQPVFFVATAPLSREGHVNCSPKGGDTFRVLGEREVAYLDLTGSGVETIAHLEENGRIVLMFCAFSGPAKIVRLHGTGKTLYPGHPRYDELRPTFPALLGVRSIIQVQVTRISDSCGHGVPLMSLEGPRGLIQAWATAKGEPGMAEYRATKNLSSIDGLPGFQP